MKRWGIATAMAILAAAAAHADTPSDFVKRHTSSGGNIDAIMADYADDAVVLQNGRAVQGKAEIRKLFAGMFGGGRAPGAGASQGGAAPGASGPPRGGMKVTKVWEEGNVGFMTWEAGPMHVTEEFIIRNNRIAVQAIFMAGSGSAPGGAPPARPAQ
ncbi:MAG: nuclear transport factor 2 family protein [Sphingobium sp.]|nr:nuclear transport factor 2 family protein [Sphingobium sp.]